MMLIMEDVWWQVVQYARSQVEDRADYQVVWQASSQVGDLVWWRNKVRLWWLVEAQVRYRVGQPIVDHILLELS